LKDKHSALLFDPIPFQNWPFNGFKSPLRHAFVAWTLQHTPEELLTVDKTLTGQGPWSSTCSSLDTLLMRLKSVKKHWVLRLG
jgi:hypothetical protein